MLAARGTSAIHASALTSTASKPLPNIAGPNTAILDHYDGQCLPAAAPTCDPTPLGCALDGQIHPDELRCNYLISQVFRPSQDIDGDHVKDLVPVGLKIVSAVPVTVVEVP